jgi:hypothetical protein
LQLSGIAAGRSPSSHVTFIGGLKGHNSSIVTEFVCDRTIVAVASPIPALPFRPPAQPQARMAAIAIGAYGDFPSGVVASTRF